ncbi:MAG: OmpA family protein [Spirochaetes bacterium]|nr:OmpA family protein [Spirochaetota bacterium]
MKRNLTTVIAAALLAVPLWAAGDDGAAKKIRFAYRAGEKYRVVTEVNEDVLVNGVLSHNSLILNKVAVDTAEVKGSSGRLQCEFQMSESIRGGFNTYYLKEDYRSEFWRDEFGVFTIDPSYFMPVVRNVPRFPDGAVRPGDTWTGDADEAHDFRRSYGIAKAFHFPVKVHYTYLRDEVKEGVKTAVLKVEFTIFHRVNYDGAPSRPVPVRITGTSSQIYWWDIAAGQFHSYREDFDFIFFLSNAATVEYRGSAEGRLLKSPKLDRDRVADDLAKSIKEGNIDDAAVRKDRNGVTIVLDNVRFPPNSPALTESEKDKLSRIAMILKRYPERDFRVTGHTARVGEEQTSQTLSEQRAMAVAEFLIAKGACRKTQVVTQGKGSREPAADNDTEEGRKRNRRVEITILEN